MSANRPRLILTTLFIAFMAALLLWGRIAQHDAELERIQQQADRDVAAAKAAAGSAARGAAEAEASARKAWNGVPGSS